MSHLLGRFPGHPAICHRSPAGSQPGVRCGTHYGVRFSSRRGLSMEVTPLGWGITIALILGLLALDLWQSLRPHQVRFREATLWSLFYIAVAIGFGLVFTAVAGGGYGVEYFAGYLVEKSLSVDNLFVFVVIMSVFAVPQIHQHKVLIIGIILALVLRVIFIMVGAALLSLFSFMFLVFGLLLLWTAVQ